MNCNCDYPARYLISRDGKPCYTCGLGRCRFYALAPVQSDGYTRVILGAPGFPPADTGVVLRFEALVHPDHKNVASFMIHVQGDPPRWEALRCEVLQDPQYEGMWYTTAKAFLYPMSQYSRVVSALKALGAPHIILEEIPTFYFRCVERLRQIPLQYSEDVVAGRERRPDPDDCVFRQLKPFQKDGVRFVIAHQGRAMIADDMGLGKTVQAIAVAHHYRDEWPVLVVCPMSLLENWAKEFNKFCSIPYTRIAILQSTKAKATSLQDVVIVSYSSLKCVEEARFKVVILDESHYIKAGAAKRAQISLKICRDSRRVLLLSGTPAMSRPVELYAQLQAIQPSIVPSKTHFGARYCNSYVSRFGVDLTGHSHTDELHSLLQHYVIRRTKKELGSELPSKSRQLLYVYVTEKEKKAMEKQVVALRRCLASTTATPTSSSTLPIGSALSTTSVDLATRTPNAFEMKMATARAKIPAVQDYVSSIVEHHVDSGEKVILFAHHQCMMEALKAAVEAVRPRQPIDYIYISGDTPAAQREPAAEHFRREPTCAVAILSMQSSGTGHNFTCASTVVFTELDWNPSTHLQCEDRVHRIGQAQPCHIKYLLAEGTSDSVIWPLLQTKLSVTTAMFESTGTAAEVHLYDGADKQNVARRDVVAGASAGGATSASTPSSSQQSTLDRFIVSLSPSQSIKGNDDGAGTCASANGISRSSLHPGQQQQRASAHLPAEREDAVALGGPPLLLTPTNLSTQQEGSLMSSPHTHTSQGSCTGQPKSSASLLVIPFAETGNVFADFVGRPQKHTFASASTAQQAGSTTVINAAATSPAAGAAPSSRRGKAGPASNDAFSSTAAPSRTSVLDLMRLTATTSPPKMMNGQPRSGTGAIAAAVGTTNHTAPVVVDLTETADTASLPPRPVPAPHALSQPPSAPQTSPVPQLVLPLVSLTGVDSRSSSTAMTTAARRRTIFTFGSATSTSVAEANVSKTEPVVSEFVNNGSVANLGCSSLVTSAPISVAQPTAPPPSTPRYSGQNSAMKITSGSSPSSASPSQSLQLAHGAPAVALSTNNGSSCGPVHIPLRPNLQFKRPRNDCDFTGSRAAPVSDSHNTEASLQAPNTRNETVEQAVTVPPPPSSAPLVASSPPLPSPLASPAAAAVFSAHPITVPHPAISSTLPVGSFSLSVPIPPVVLTASVPASAMPRRTLFKLVSNAGPEQPRKIS